MSIVYRKSLKGIDEVAFKSTGLPMRMASYLLVVDGESSVDQLAARNPQLPSSSIVLQGLMGAGFSGGGFHICQCCLNDTDAGGQWRERDGFTTGPTTPTAAHVSERTRLDVGAGDEFIPRA